MPVKKLRPTTPGQRHKIKNTLSEITASKPEKSLLAPISKSGGRNNQGRMTMRYIGGGHKRRYRIIDFKRNKFGVEGTVETIEYDPNRSARIALVKYSDNEKRYIIAPRGLQVGQKIKNGEGAPVTVGNALMLKEIPLGTIVHNVEMRPGQGGVIARGAGSYAQLNARDGKYAILKMPSGETRMLLANCMATVGSVSNAERSLERSGKAGRTRWQGRRPRVRGVVMNPVDHPMGGGEGRNAGGHPRSRNGIPAKGYKTRHKKKASNKYIIERKKK